MTPTGLLMEGVILGKTILNCDHGGAKGGGPAEAILLHGKPSPSTDLRFCRKTHSNYGSENQGPVKCRCPRVLCRGIRSWPVSGGGNTNRWLGSILPPHAHEAPPPPSGSRSCPARPKPWANPPVRSRAATTPRLSCRHCSPSERPGAGALCRSLPPPWGQQCQPPPPGTLAARRRLPSLVRPVLRQPKAVPVIAVSWPVLETVRQCP